MWEKTLIESKGFSRFQRRWWTLPAAAGLHAFVIFTAIFISYWRVEALEAPAERLVRWTPIPVQLAIPKEGGGKAEVRPQKKVSPSPQRRGSAEIGKRILSSEFTPPLDVSAVKLGSETDAPMGEGISNGSEDGWGTVTGPGLVAEAEEDVVEVFKAGVIEPVLIRRVEPEYPRAAIAIRLQGMVVLRAVITKNGDVEQVKTLRADHVLFEKAAMDAVLQWKYRPATFQGRPVKVYFTVTVTFRLR